MSLWVLIPAVFTAGCFSGVAGLSLIVRRDLKKMERERELWQKHHG